MADSLPVVVEARPGFLPATDVLKRVVSFPVFLASLLVGVACFSAHVRFVDPDTWWHIKVGEQILQTHHWPSKDVFSFTVPGAPWMAYEWLGEVVLALAARLGGFTGLAVLEFGLASAVTVLLFAYVWLRCGNCKAAFAACLLVLPGVGAFFTLRPQLLGYVFLLVTLILLERYRQGRAKNLWLLPPLFLVWVNTHGTFVLAALAIALYWTCGLFRFRKGGLEAERWSPGQRRHLLAVMLLCAVAVPWTPYGARLAAYPLQMAFFQPLNVANIMEWQPMSFDLVLGKAILIVVLAFFVAQVAFGLTYRLELLVLLLLSAFAACAHIRFILFFLFMFTPVLAAVLARWVPPYKPEKDLRAVNAAIMAAILVAAVSYLRHTDRLISAFAQTYPVQAVEYLRQHPVRAPMLNEYGWGGYLIWSFGPEHRVFIDGRADIYEYGGVLDDYLHITTLKPDALLMLRKYDIGACLIQPNSPLATFLAASPDWERRYSDDVAVLYVRR